MSGYCNNCGWTACDCPPNPGISRAEAEEENGRLGICKCCGERKFIRYKFHQCNDCLNLELEDK